MRAPRRSSVYWRAWLDASARYWRYPVLTPAVHKECHALGIQIDGRLQRASGVERLARFLCAVEGPLSDILYKAPAADGRISVPRDFESGRYSSAQVWKLPAILAPLQEQDPQGVSLFLHGSMTDLQITPFSDIDDLVVLRRAAWQDPALLARAATTLARIARGYQEVDPLQHHGHWLVTEFDLLLYDQSVLPLVALEDAVRVSGQADIVCRIDPGLDGFARNAVATIQAMTARLAATARQTGLNAFELKGLAGEVAILPAYLFQSRGECLAKPEAIHRAGELYSPHALQALDWATTVRDGFGELVQNGRTRLLARIAGWGCARREQAEALFRRFSVRVGAQHRLGLGPGVTDAIAAFLQESTALIKAPVA
jgi:hypothetical protein